MSTNCPIITKLSELDQLPYFTKDAHGRLIVDPKLHDPVPRVLDIHAHMGWSYGLVGKRLKVSERTKNFWYWYDYEDDEGKDILCKEIHPTDREDSRLLRQIVSGVLVLSKYNETHTAANLAAEMDRMNHEKACINPIANFLLGKTNVDDSYEAFKYDRKRFIPFASLTLPTFLRKWGDKEKKRLDELLALSGVKGVKFHPEFQLCSPEHDSAIAFLRQSALNGIPVLAHIGFTGKEPKWLRKHGEPRLFRRALDEIQDLRIIFAHTGLSVYREVLCLAKDYEDKVWLETSGLPVPALNRILNEYDPKKIVYGSDWPFYPLAVALARVLVATESCVDCRKDILYDNAARLLGIPTVEENDREERHE